MKAWEELSETEYDDVWNRFTRKFRFRPGISAKDWPGILEPPPFKTYSIPDPWPDADRVDLHEHALMAFRHALPVNSSMFALDWQHACFRFRPHTSIETWPWPNLVHRGLLPNHQVQFEDRWAIPVLPNGDYYIFLAPDLDWGWFGHPWEQTICVFGERMLAALAGHRPGLLRNVLRESVDD